MENSAQRKDVFARLYLVMAAMTVMLVGIAYGMTPEGSLNRLFGLEIEIADQTLIHMLRALAGLYVGMALFWLVGAWKKALTLPALWSLAVFMVAVACGRIASFAIDGWPFWIFDFFCFAEILMGTLAGWLIVSSKGPSSDLRDI